MCCDEIVPIQSYKSTVSIGNHYSTPLARMTHKNSYATIIKSSSIIGGASGVTILLGMVRVKFASVLIGTTGIGLMASLTTIQGLLGTVCGLGIGSSAVRGVAAAVGRQDDRAIGTAVLVLRRICWLTGLSGMAAMMLLSPLLSHLTFGSDAYAYEIAALGLVVLFSNIASGQMALIQGLRRINDIVRVNIIGAVFATVAAVGFYTWLGLRGIVPALVGVAAMQLTISWYFARRVPVPPVELSWRQTFREAGGMVRLGFVFMWTALMSVGVSYIAVMMITQKSGLQAVGLYSAAFSLSGVFANFVLSAMGTDYYPRLTGAANDKAAMVRMVNEQIEISVLLALPGLVATMTLAPWILQLFYTREFLGAVELLQWFIVGCLGRVISVPVGYVMLALGKGRWYLVTETCISLLHVALIALGLQLFGIEGVAVAFVVMYVAYIAVVLFVSRHLIEFRWSTDCTRLVVLSLPVLGIIFTAARMLTIWPATCLGLLLTIVASVLSLRGMIARVGSEHRIVSAIKRMPGGKLLLSVH